MQELFIKNFLLERLTNAVFSFGSGLFYHFLIVCCSYTVAAEQKARTTYDNILRLVKDCPDVYEPIKFLRAREIVHFQRFGEALRITQDKLNSKNFYAFNPGFDTCS